MSALKIKKGDTVKVIAGKDNGKEGKVLVVDQKNAKVVVEGVNMVSKHMKPSQANQNGGIVQKEAAIDISNVMLVFKGFFSRIETPLYVSFAFSSPISVIAGNFPFPAFISVTVIS